MKCCEDPERQFWEFFIWQQLNRTQNGITRFRSIEFGSNPPFFTFYLIPASKDVLLDVGHVSWWWGFWMLNPWCGNRAWLMIPNHYAFRFWDPQWSRSPLSRWSHFWQRRSLWKHRSGWSWRGSSCMHAMAGPRAFFHSLSSSLPFFLFFSHSFSRETSTLRGSTPVSDDSHKMYSYLPDPLGKKRGQNH